MSKQNKKIAITGMAFNFSWITKMFNLKYGEVSDMERLAKEAKEGWITTDMKGMSYYLEKQEPQDLVYSIDYKDLADEEYFETIESSGWKRVASINYIHLFSAPEGTAPLHTDVETKLHVLAHEMRRYGYWTVISILLLMLTNFFTDYALEQDIQWLSIFALILTGVMLVLTLFTLLPFLGYMVRYNKTKKTRI